MPGPSYDPKAVVPGAEATFTVAGIAVGMVLGFVGPWWAAGAAAVGAVLAVVGWTLKKPAAIRVLGRFGLGLAVGAALFWALAGLGLLSSRTV